MPFLALTYTWGASYLWGILVTDLQKVVVEAHRTLFRTAIMVWCGLTEF